MVASDRLKRCGTLAMDFSGSDTTIYFLDDDQSLCEAMRRFLQYSGLRVETFNSARDFFAEADLQRPSCLISDVCLPDINGVDLLERLITQGTPIPVVLITGFGDVPTAVRAMAAGAIDFLEKPFSEEELLQSVRRAIWADEKNRQKLDISADVRMRMQHLTPREREVMDLIISGRQNKEVAYSLAISPRTVEKYRAIVMYKMQAKNLASLVQMAIGAGTME